MAEKESSNDYRCLNGHVFAAPNAPHGGPWSTLVCPVCGATAALFDVPDGQFGSPEDAIAYTKTDEFRQRFEAAQKRIREALDG